MNDIFSDFKPFIPVDLAITDELDLCTNKKINEKHKVHLYDIIDKLYSNIDIIYKLIRVYKKNKNYKRDRRNRNHKTKTKTIWFT